MEAVVFYEKQAEGLGRRLLDDVGHSTQLLSEQPLIEQQFDGQPGYWRERLDR